MAAPEVTERRRRALLIASASYADPALASLRAPTGDVEALAAVLADEAIGGFEVDQLVDRPTDAIKKRIEDFFRDSRRNDLLLLYFSGHGVLSQDRRFYFATATTELEWVRTTAIDDRFVNEAMDQSRARSIVLVLDCCHSGAFGKGLVPKSALSADVEHRFDGHGRVTLTASNALEYAFEETDPATGINQLETAAPGSLFTRCLVEGLRSGEADTDDDGAVSVDDLYDYVKHRVRELSPHQSPRMSGDVSGDIVIARSARAAKLPPELLHAVDSNLAGIREGAVSELATLAAGPAPLAAVARDALRRLANDDSRRVSEAAKAALGERPPPAPPAPPAPPEPAPVPRRRPRRGWIIAAAGAVIAAAVVAALLLSPDDDDGAGGGARAVPYDIDGNRTPEVVVAAARATPADGVAGAGVVIVHPGPGASDASAIVADDAGVAGQRGSDRFGAALASGDFDADGRADLAVGTPGRNLVAVLYGSAEGLQPRGAPLAANQLEQPAPAGDFGSALAAGDMDGDGISDLVVGTPGTRADREAETAGGVHIFFGQDGKGLSASKVRALEPPSEAAPGFGQVLAVGDLDADRDLEVVEGTLEEPSLDYTGHLSLCEGESGGPTACEQFPGSEGLGTSALAIADVNGDGIGDLVQGDYAPYPGPEETNGEFRLWVGQESGAAPEKLTFGQGDRGIAGSGEPGDNFGYDVEAGNLDGNEFADAIVSAPRDGQGTVTIIYGARTAAGKLESYVLRYDGSAGRFGEALSLLDVDGDRKLDIVVAIGGAETLDEALLVYPGADGIGPDTEGIPLEGLSELAALDRPPLRIGR